MITHLHIENFKSLVDFDLPPKGYELTPFTCLIGLNGSGKSTLLQAFDFVAQVARGEVQDWLDARGWKSGELVSHLGAKKTWVITFTVKFKCADGKQAEWSAKFNTKMLRCTQESVLLGGKPIMKVHDGHYSVAGAEPDATIKSAEKIAFEYSGSFLSRLKLTDMHPALTEIKGELLALRSLELLSPQAMHRRAKGGDDIGTGGEKLSSYLATLAPEQKASLITKLQGFYPQFKNLNVNTMRFGWKNLRVWENYDGSPGTDATHLNDGLLRVIAILAQSYTTKHKFLLFDEIENGVNPALVEKLMDFLVALGTAGKQVVVTTHSPVILNFLEDDVARESVVMIYKTSGGQTRSCRFFEQPETDYKLKILGPGEVFVDTNLTDMADRLANDLLSVPTGMGTEGEK
jgi:predicted ATPase